MRKEDEEKERRMVKAQKTIEARKREIDVMAQKRKTEGGIWWKESLCC